MIPQDTIEKIFDTVRVEEIVGDFVELKKAGVNYKGRCPFHDEKTPSFVVSPTKGIYKCFGCQKGGNSINFIQELQGVSYPEALRYAADKYNIEIEEQELTPEQESRMSAKESQFIATKFASEYFQNVLWNTSEGKAVGLSYFKERGFSEATIKKFELGYNPKAKDAFSKAALKNAYDKQVLVASGLCLKNSSSFMTELVVSVSSSLNISSLGGSMNRYTDIIADAIVPIARPPTEPLNSQPNMTSDVTSNHASAVRPCSNFIFMTIKLKR